MDNPDLISPRRNYQPNPSGEPVRGPTRPTILTTYAVLPDPTTVCAYYKFGE